MGSDTGASEPLTPAERARLDALRAAETLAELIEITSAADEHAAYFSAKAAWRDLRGREIDADGLPTCARAPDTTAPEPSLGSDAGPLPGSDAGPLPGSDAEPLPGSCVEIDGHTFTVHGITHADTAEEGEYLREHVREFLDRGATVYCEQGIRRLYFQELDGVCVMDDYRWAMQECRERGIESHATGTLDGFDSIAEEVDSLTDDFREAAFSLIDAGSDVYGERFRAALGDVASAFLTSHESAAIASDFDSFSLSRRAATDPTLLPALQRYYERAFLPQPVEREWLRRHDPELEIVTHARNERMADYAVAHNDTAEEVHLVVGAAHQPGVRYYLEAIRDGVREVHYEPV
jgi:hypothetical protein